MPRWAWSWRSARGPWGCSWCVSAACARCARPSRPRRNKAPGSFDSLAEAVERQGRGDQRAFAGRAVDLEPTIERLDAIIEPDQPRAPFEPGATGAVVSDFDSQHAVVHLGPDLDPLGPGVLDGVRERFADDEVGGRLDPWREALLGNVGGGRHRGARQD